MAGIYFYLLILFLVFAFLLYKFITKRRQEKLDYEEREDNVFYDTVKNIKRDE